MTIRHVIECLMLFSVQSLLTDKAGDLVFQLLIFDNMTVVLNRVDKEGFTSWKQCRKRGPERGQKRVVCIPVALGIVTKLEVHTTRRDACTLASGHASRGGCSSGLSHIENPVL